MAIPLVPIALGLKGAELIGNLFRKSDKEIREEQIREYLKRRAQLRDRSLQRLSEETGKNIGRINQFTTGSIKRGQGDISALRASKGMGFDEADMLSLQGQANEQGSNAIQSTQDKADAYRRQIEEGYEQDVMNAEMEGITAPQDPDFTDVLGSLASPVLQYGMNQEYLDKAFPTGETGNMGMTYPSKEVPADFSVEGMSKTDRLTNVSNVPANPNSLDEGQLDLTNNGYNNIFRRPSRRNLRSSFSGEYNFKPKSLYQTELR